MSTGRGDTHQERSRAEREPTDEEIRAAYEAQIKQVRVEHVLLEHVVTIVNLGMRRTGLAPGTEDERDAEQVRLAIESVRALMPMLEQTSPSHAAQLREALSQLQLAFVKIGGQQAAPPKPGQPSQAEPGEPPPREPGEAGEAKRQEPGPAQSSGRLWVPGR